MTGIAAADPGKNAHWFGDDSQFWMSLQARQGRVTS
ncbi:hypothetical protein BTHA_801 [Burkholderia thailandensis MSMB59]|nr:hypothetical protein BTHA_801 [Burkholderia thailandensis MSMB59]